MVKKGNAAAFLGKAIYFKSREGEGPMRNQKRSGLWTIKNSMSGELEKVTYKDGEKNGSYVVYLPGGEIDREGFYQDNKKSGYWIFYQRNILSDGYPSYLFDVREEGHYHDNKREGIWVVRFQTGIVQSRGEYSRGLKEGVWRYYDNESILREQITYVNDLREGPYQLFNWKGQLLVSGNFRQGKAHGHFVRYFDNGRISAEADISEGKFNGSFTQYQNGRIVKNLKFHDDKLVDDQGREIPNPSLGEKMNIFHLRLI